MAANVGGAVLTTYRTIDVDAPVVEAALRRGGSNNDGTFEHVQVVGVESLP